MCEEETSCSYDTGMTNVGGSTPDKSHRKFQVHCQDHCQLHVHYSVCRTLFVRIRLQSCEQFSQSRVGGGGGLNKSIWYCLHVKCIKVIYNKSICYCQMYKIITLGGHHSITKVRGAGVFELDKLFISPPVCIILFISHSVSSKIFISLSLKKSVYKVGSQTRLNID